VLDRQREMIVLLKLYDRLSPSFAASQGQEVVRPKIIRFDREKGVAVEEVPQSQGSKISFASFANRLTDQANPPWATLDVGGHLLISTNKQRLTTLLGGPLYPYSLEHLGQRTVLVRRLENGTNIRGWLEENPQDKSRPRAKFEIVKPSER
jgi:hypothetical protein